VQLEQQISATKKLYAETLQNLEKISDDIHTQRHQEQQRVKKARKLAKAAGNEMIIYHPLMDVASSSSDDDSGNETSGDADSTELAVPALLGVMAVTNRSVRQIDCVPVPNTSGQLPVATSKHINTVKLSIVDGSTGTQLNTQQTKTSIEKSSTPADADTGDLSSSIHRSSSLAESTLSPMSPESDIEQLQANAAVMAAISRSKLQRVTSPFLRPDSCREDLNVNGGSETESVSGSFVSGGIGILDDEQIESLMVDVTEFQRIATDMDATDSDRYQQMALPARLRHLQDFVKFEPVWIDDEGDDSELVGAAQNSDTECQGTKIADDCIFAHNESIEFINSELHSSCSQSTDSTLENKECKADDLWHPLIDNVSSRTTIGHE